MNTWVVPSTTMIKSVRMSTEIFFTFAAASGVPAVAGVVRVPESVTVFFVWFQSTFFPMTSPMARTGR